MDLPSFRGNEYLGCINNIRELLAPGKRTKTSRESPRLRDFFGIALEGLFS